MGKIYGSAITLDLTISMKTKAPLDDRVSVQTYDDLNSLNTYIGLVCYVESEDSLYYFTGTRWKKVGENQLFYPKQYIDGKWYWSYNGEYIIDEQNNKILINLSIDDLSTPLTRSDDFYLYVSFDQGDTWIILLTEHNEESGTNVSLDGYILTVENTSFDLSDFVIKQGLSVGDTVMLGMVNAGKSIGTVINYIKQATPTSIVDELNDVTIDVADGEHTINSENSSVLFCLASKGKYTSIEFSYTTDLGEMSGNLYKAPRSTDLYDVWYYNLLGDSSKDYDILLTFFGSTSLVYGGPVQVDNSVDAIKQVMESTSSSELKRKLNNLSNEYVAGYALIKMNTSLLAFVIPTSENISLDGNSTNINTGVLELSDENFNKVLFGSETVYYYVNLLAGKYPINLRINFNKN